MTPGPAAASQTTTTTVQGQWIVVLLYHNIYATKDAQQVP